MIRYSLAAFAALWTVVPAVASSGADALFDELSKDFGAVPRGPTLQHTFTLTNKTNDTVRLSRLRVSCGCVTATAARSVLQPGEATSLVVYMDTSHFTGLRSVTIHVQFDQPRNEEVLLWVRANSRDDVSISPQTLALGQVRRGSNPSASVTVTFHGGNQSKITEVRTETNYVQAAVEELRRLDNEVAYRLTARVRSDAPVGKWHTDVWLKTNNSAWAQMRVPLTVEIESPLSVSPELVNLGSVKNGLEVERRVIVRGVKPFKITAIRGTDSALSVKDSTSNASAVHVLTVKLKATQAGEVSRSLHVVTDLDGQAIDFRASGKVTP